MYYLVQIDVYQISQNQTTYRVTETKPKEVESSSKTVMILSSHKNKYLAVKAMIENCSDQDYMYIEGTQYYHEQLVELAAKWAKEYATR